MKIIEFIFDSETHPYPKAFSMTQNEKPLPDVVRRLAFQVWYEEERTPLICEGICYSYWKSHKHIDGSIVIQNESVDLDKYFNIQIQTLINGIMMKLTLEHIYFTRYTTSKGKIDGEFSAANYNSWK